MKIGLMIAVALSIGGCAVHDLRIQIEDRDGRERSYVTHLESGGGGEVWDCRQVNSGKRRATYSCEAMLLTY